MAFFLQKSDFKNSEKNAVVNNLKKNPHFAKKI